MALPPSLQLVPVTALGCQGSQQDVLGGGLGTG